MPSDSGNNTPRVVDGRTARRERGKAAVLEAILDLVEETDGLGESSPEEIAERAGVSVASLFRYFGTLDGMHQAASEYWFAKNADLVAMPAITDGTLAERIDRLLEWRIALFESSKPWSRRLRRIADVNEEGRRRLIEVRAARFQQITEYLKPELSRHDPSEAENLVKVIGTLISHESLSQLTEQEGMSIDEVKIPLRNALTCLLVNTGRPAPQ